MTAAVGGITIGRPSCVFRDPLAQVEPLSESWTAVSVSSLHSLEEGLEALSSVRAIPATVPGTAAGALRALGRWGFGDARRFDAEHWWWRCRFPRRGPRADETLLRFEGIASIADVWLNGEHVLASESMFLVHDIRADPWLRDENELVIRCRALDEWLKERPGRPRWRTRLVETQALRFARTTLIGRAPGFASEPAPVGPWRPVLLLHRHELAVDDIRLRTSLQDGVGVLDVKVELRTLSGPQPNAARIALEGAESTHHASLTIECSGTVHIASGQLHIPAVARWWPHTHGSPDLYVATLHVESAQRSIAVGLGRVGFRMLEGDLAAGQPLRINGVDLFARGAAWQPLDPVTLQATPEQLAVTLHAVRDAGMNLLRIPGMSVYETSAFHDLCDELGIMVWQDIMLSNLDYPAHNERFAAILRREIIEVAASLAAHPSLACTCGGSEIEQQPAMLGLTPQDHRALLVDEIPAAIAAQQVDALHVRSSPCGGSLPFRPNAGVAHYYGVGPYRRPLEDARRAEVLFAAETLGFAHVPDDAMLDELFAGVPSPPYAHHPRWKLGTPRDGGMGIDFDDHRDFYLQQLFDVDPGRLRLEDHGRYLALSRMVTGEILAAVLGEWRRKRSTCHGALVWMLKDLMPGCGWGLLDVRGEPKPVWWPVRRILQPIAVWMTDEGTNGLAIHVANDRPVQLSARLLVQAWAGRNCIAEGTIPVSVAPGLAVQHDAEAVLGRFIDASYSYLFGPPGHDTVVARLVTDAGRLLSEAFAFPARIARVLERDPGLTARATPDNNGAYVVSIEAQQVAYGVVCDVPGFRADDAWFSVAPGHARTLRLTPSKPGSTWRGGAMETLSGRTRTPIER